MRKLFKIITNKIVVTAFFFLLQIAFSVMLLLVITSISAWIYAAFSLLSLFVCLFILGKDANPGYKLAWVIPLLLVPLFGGMMYISFGRTAKLKRRVRKRFEESEKKSREYYSNARERTISNLPLLTDDARKLSELLFTQSGYPLYGDTDVTYYPLGEDFVAAMKADLEKAERYIFMEYFIIERGKCWNGILDILCAKAAAGVDVRLIYDDIGCLFTLPAGYAKKLNTMGVKTHVFNKIKPTFNIRMNNRTHRKITVIDGSVAYTGGANLADEYINEIDKFGHWKDTAVRLDGEAAQSFAVMFLHFWQFLEKESSPADGYLPKLPQKECKGFVQPVSSDPAKNVQPIEKGLMTIIHNADKYVYLNTP